MAWSPPARKVVAVTLETPEHMKKKPKKRKAAPLTDDVDLLDAGMGVEVPAAKPKKRKRVHASLADDENDELLESECPHAPAGMCLGCAYALIRVCVVRHRT